MISKEEMKEALRVGDDRTVIEYIEQLENKLREQEENIEDYERILDIFDKREYRKKYLEERRKEEKGLLYPDADEIYKKYYELKDDKQKLIDKLEEYVNNTKKEKLPYFKTVADMIRYKGYAEGRIEACNEILSIVRGENKRQ